MGPESKGILSINGKGIAIATDVTLEVKPRQADEDPLYGKLSTGIIEATVSLKLNCWNRLKMWWMLKKLQFAKVKTYTVEMKWLK